MSGRYALIIGNSHYDDTSLSRLKTPEADAHALATALRDPAIGGFDDVQEMINQPEASVRRAISTFFLKKKSDDLLLLYFSGHGVLDAQGRLFLAAKDTQRDLLNATGIPAGFISDDMDACRSKRQILILDCCHSGAFGKGTKGDAPAVTATTFEGNGYGRVVLTASDSTQYALEGDQVIEQASLSLFTNYLLEGLNTGEADGAQDGVITLDEWYDYAYDRVVGETPEQTPRKWVYNQQGELIIAKNPNPKKAEPADLPDELKLALQSPFIGVRTDAVEELKRLLTGSNPALEEVAYQALLKVAASDDSKSIAGTAAAALTAYDPLWHLREPAEAGATVDQVRLAELQAEAEHQALDEIEAERRVQADAARQEQERARAERLAAEQREREKAKAEAERLEQERAQVEAQRQEQERAMAARLEAERQERARAAAAQRAQAERQARSQAGPQGVTYLPFNGELRTPLAKSGETVELVIDVPGGEAKSLTVDFSDPKGELVFSPSSAQITIQPGYNTVVKYRVALRQTPLVSFRAAHAYQARITASSGETQTLAGTVTALPRLPIWLLAAIAIAGIICLAGGATLAGNLFSNRGQAATQTASAEGTRVAIAVQTQSHEETAPVSPPTAQDTQMAATDIVPTTAAVQSPEVTVPVVIPTTAVATHAPPVTGGQLVFASNRDGNWDVYRMNEDGSDLRRLTNHPRDDSFPVWSPDGKKILFHSDRNGNFDIFVMNPDGSGLRQLTNDSRADTFASWSPDGSQIVFQSKRDGPKQLYLMNADGSGQWRLTHSGVDDQFPAWSPDGGWILYSSEIDKILQLSIIRVDGSDQRQLTFGHESYSFPAWSPDGSSIAAAYKTGDKEEIILGRYDASAMTFTWITGLTDESGKDTQPRWSPDGKTIYFSTNRNGNFDLYRMDADGGNVVWLSVDPSDEEAASVYP